MIIQRNIPRAFTIMELVVALAVTVLMMIMINALFQATSDGVTVGIALSDVIGAGRAISDQLERDAELMVGPGENPPGVLVIVCEKYNNRFYLNRRYEKQRPLRMDQVMWVRGLGKGINGFSASPITPASDATFSPPTKTQMANVDDGVLVWYGHVRKTTEDGSTAPAFNVDGPNKNANAYALGRHATFMVNDVNPTTFVSTAPGFNHAVKGASANTSVTGISRPGGGSVSMFHGVTDVAYLEYAGDAGKAADNPGVFMVTSGAKGSEVNPNTLWHTDAVGTYQDRALSYMFLQNNRLWANPFPRALYNDTKSWVTSGQVAQMHSIVCPNISDFIVEFAADAVDDAAVPNDVDGFDGGPDVYEAGAAAGETIWYGLENNDATNSRAAPTWFLRTGYTADDIPNVVSAPPGDADRALASAYVFRHGLTAAGAPRWKMWPYMIRIRYRIQDARGELLGETSQEIGDTSNVGRWFEQIIKVKRG